MDLEIGKAFILAGGLGNKIQANYIRVELLQRQKKTGEPKTLREKTFIEFIAKHPPLIQGDSHLYFFQRKSVKDRF